MLNYADGRIIVQVYLRANQQFTFFDGIISKIINFLEIRLYKFSDNGFLEGYVITGWTVFYILMGLLSLIIIINIFYRRKK